jgi:hypothetical protein
MGLEYIGLMSLPGVAPLAFFISIDFHTRARPLLVFKPSFRNIN